jgi:hypothetical protein
MPLQHLYPLLALFKDILQQRFFKWLHLAEWAGMNGFLLGFQERLKGILAKAEELRSLYQKTSRHLNTLHELAERDALFVLEALCHREEGQLAPCGVPQAHLLQNTAGLDETRHGMQPGLKGKLRCEGMEG